MLQKSGWWAGLARRRRDIGMGVWGARPPDNVSVGTLFGAPSGGQTNLKRANPRWARRESARSRKTMARRRRATAVPPKGGLWRTGTPPVQEPDKGNRPSGAAKGARPYSSQPNAIWVDAAANLPQRYENGGAPRRPTDREGRAPARRGHRRPRRELAARDRQHAEPTRAVRRASAAP